MKEYSEKTAVEIDTEVRGIIMNSYERAKALLQANIEVLHKMAEHLLEKEVLDGAEITDIIQRFGKRTPKPWIVCGTFK